MFLDRNQSSSITLSLASFALACSYLAAAPSAMAQPAKPSVKPADKPAEVLQGLRVLTGIDAKRADELEKGIAAAEDADNRGEAIAKAEELLALRTRVQGPEHFQTVDTVWWIKALRRVAALPKEDRLAGQDSQALSERADHLEAEGQYTRAQPLRESTLEICRRLLSDEHPFTAIAYANLACNLTRQGNFLAAQPLHERALAIVRELLGDECPKAAVCYSNLAACLNGRGDYVQAQRLYETALQVCRRILTDGHPLTASSYNNLAANLNDQGKSAEAQPLHEKALEIRRRLLGQADLETAQSLNNVAYTLDAQGKYEQAQPLYQKALEILVRSVGPDALGAAYCYSNLATNLHAQRRFLEAQSRFEKALEIFRRRLTDENPRVALAYNNLAANLNAQRKYDEAQSICEKALDFYRRQHIDDHPDMARLCNTIASSLAGRGKYAEAERMLERTLQIRRHFLGEDHPDTASAYIALAANLNARGKYLEACDQWRRAVKGLDEARLRVAFTGLERARADGSPRPALAAVLARLGQHNEAWRALEEDSGRGLLDELAARRDQGLRPAERTQLRVLVAALERLDRLFETLERPDRLAETTPTELDNAERARRFEDLKHQRELASIALGEFRARLVKDHIEAKGDVTTLNEIQAALPEDTAFVAWVDIEPTGPNAADPDGEHWGVVVRSRGTPAWIPTRGTGPDGLWTADDTGLPERLRTELRRRPGVSTTDLSPLVERLRIQRFEPMAEALGARPGGLPAARKLVVLPSRAMAGIPIEVLLTAEETRSVSYAPSATVYKYLRDQPRPDRHAGLLAVGDPVYDRADESRAAPPLPDRGLLIDVVYPGSYAATLGLKHGDVLRSVDGRAINKKDDLKFALEAGKPIVVEVWRDGRTFRRDLAPGKLGVDPAPEPAPVAVAEERRLDRALALARRGGEKLDRLEGTREEVQSVARLFTVDSRPTKVLLGADANEPEIDRLAASGELGRFGFIHLAAHGRIDQAVPVRSAVILTQTGLPDPLEQELQHKPVFDGRLSVGEIQRGWDLKAELVTLSACETALGREAGGEGFVGFTQALLMSGARSVCLSLWEVDDQATALLMQRFYENLLGRRAALSGPLGKAESLKEAKAWLRTWSSDRPNEGVAAGSRGGRRKREGDPVVKHPYDHAYFWAAFILVGDPS